MIPCPKCGNFEYRESRQCPQLDGALVCIRCCMECGYYEHNALTAPCRYHVYNPKPDYRSEIEKLERQIAVKERQIERFYQNDKSWIAEKIEKEASWLRGEKRKWERKRDEETEKTGVAI